jgi:Tfp pilus assembly protein PilF
MRARRATAALETQIGIEDASGGNLGGAGMHLRRALAANPAAAPAAAALARMLHRRGARAEAAALLRRTHEAARGLPRSVAILAGVASELQVDLGIAGDGTGATSTSTAPAVREGNQGPD